MKGLIVNCATGEAKIVEDGITMPVIDTSSSDAAKQAGTIDIVKLKAALKKAGINDEVS
jgi:hypothetical protein